MNLFETIRPGDRVTIVNRFGQEHTGRCVMKFAAHAVLNLGGAHGTPGIATDANVVRVRKAPVRREPAVLHDAHVRAWRPWDRRIRIEGATFDRRELRDLWGGE